MEIDKLLSILKTHLLQGILGQMLKQDVQGELTSRSQYCANWPGWANSAL